MSQGSDLTKEDNSKPTDVKTQLIHIVPFDYGFCFAKKNSASNLLQKIERFCEQENYQVKNLKAPFLCAVTINQNLSCRFFRCGVGVFVLQGGHSFRRNDGFPLDDLAGRLYWVKKTEQREILEYRTKDALQLKQFCEKLRTLFSTTSFSAKSQYKHKGLSYVLTVYVLREPVKDFDIDALMNPAIFSGILNQDQWINIAEARKRYQSKGYEVEPLDEST